MDRIKWFEDTLAKCEFALKQDPSIIPLEWVIAQLKSLIEIEKNNKDYSGLYKIKIGWIAAREMDGYENKDLIHSLCMISNEVDKMILEKELSNKNKRSE